MMKILQRLSAEYRHLALNNSWVEKKCCKKILCEIVTKMFSPFKLYTRLYPKTESEL